MTLLISIETHAGNFFEFAADTITTITTPEGTVIEAFCNDQHRAHIEQVRSFSVQEIETQCEHCGEMPGDE